jgi:hypothetical protein
MAPRQDGGSDVGEFEAIQNALASGRQRPVEASEALGRLPGVGEVSQILDLDSERLERRRRSGRPTTVLGRPSSPVFIKCDGSGPGRESPGRPRARGLEWSDAPSASQSRSVQSCRGDRQRALEDATLIRIFPRCTFS